MPIDRIKLPDNTVHELRDPRMGNARIFYGTCSSAAADLEKVVVCPDFTANDLVKGAAILVTFDNTSTAAVANVTMNVNSTGAFHIYKIYNNGYSNLSYAGDLRANMTHLFVFSGSSTWIVCGLDYNANTTYSKMTQAQADDGTGTTGYIISPAVLQAKILNMLEANQADWEETDTTAPAYIKNKPSDSTQTISDVVFTKHSVSDNVTSARVKEVRGKSLVWNQLIKNGDFSNGTTGWKVRDQASTTLSIDRGMLKISKTGSYYALGQELGTPHKIGHKYLLSFYFEKDEGISVSYMQVNFINAFNEGVGRSALSISYPGNGYHSLIYDFPTSATKYLVIYTSNNNGTSVYIDNFQLIDLTLMFGEGNEPATVEEFERMFPLPYYEYNPGTIINNEATGIRTRGFNLYNHATGKAVLPGKYSDYPYEYEICGAFTSISFEDYAGNVSTPELHDGRFFNVPSPGVLTVTGGNDTDTLVHLVWSGWRNFGEPDYAYEKYWENTLQLNIKSITGKLNGEGESVTIFPEGMRGAGTAYDSLIVDPDGYARRAVVRIGSVDMGTLQWTGSASTRYSAILNTLKIAASNSAIVGMLTIPYAYVPSGMVESNNKVISSNNGVPTGTVMLRDTDITTTIDVSNTLSGVPLYFELATPLTYVLDTPIYMCIKTEQGGVISQLPENGSEPTTAPMRMDITYALPPEALISGSSLENLLNALKTANKITNYTMTYNPTSGKWEFTIS